MTTEELEEFINQCLKKSETKSSHFIAMVNSNHINKYLKQMEREQELVITKLREDDLQTVNFFNQEQLEECIKKLINASELTAHLNWMSTQPEEAKQEFKRVFERVINQHLDEKHT